MDANVRPGWYPAPEGDGRQRYWDGQRWDGPSLRPPAYSPVPLMVMGAVGVMFGGIITSMGTADVGGIGEAFELIGFALLVVAGLTLLVGAIAAGVRLGIQHADWDKRA